MARCYMIAMDLEHKTCLVVGGGPVAERKVMVLLDCGGRIKLVSPHLTATLNRLAISGTITYKQGEYEASDLAEAFIVIAATGRDEVNRRVADDCAKHNLLVNVVDDPASANFFVPATLRRGSLQIAISTDGKSPVLARRIREALEEKYTADFGTFVDFLGNLRAKILAEVPDPRQRSMLLKGLVDQETLRLAQEGYLELAKERVQKCMLQLSE